jgi:hypothetical protein
MNYMTAHEAAPAQPDCPHVRGRYLNFDAKRAGRELADLRLENVRHVIVQPYNLSGKCDVPLVVAEPLRGLFTWWDWDAHDLSLLTEAEIVEIPSAPSEDEDAALVQWFSEHQVAAQRAIEAGTAAPRNIDQGEVVLARRGGLRSMSWRGAGTMRRR